MPDANETSRGRRFEIRPATIADIDAIASHRASMFQEMGVLPPALRDQLMDLTRGFLREAIPSGEYAGWVATAGGAAGVVGGAGAQTSRVMPFPRRRSGGATDLAEGRQAIVLNVFTDPLFRRQGIARALICEVLTWAQRVHVERLVLRATPEARPLYEALGFVATNEMQFAGDLATWRRPLPR